jgi:hypothetical protein
LKGGIWIEIFFSFARICARIDRARESERERKRERENLLGISSADVTWLLRREGEQASEREEEGKKKEQR